MSCHGALGIIKQKFTQIYGIIYVGFKENRAVINESDSFRL